MRKIWFEDVHTPDMIKFWNNGKEFEINVNFETFEYNDVQCMVQIKYHNIVMCDELYCTIEKNYIFFDDFIVSYETMKDVKEYLVNTIKTFLTSSSNEWVFDRGLYNIVKEVVSNF